MPANTATRRALPSNASWSEDHCERGHSLADRVEAIAVELRFLLDHEPECVAREKTLQGVASQVYHARRKVDEIFDMSGFAISPAWDMLLDMYLAKPHAKKMSITSACIGAACPATTGLRWLQVLENMQLIEREADPSDKRRYVVGLTDTGRLKVECALASYI